MCGIIFAKRSGNKPVSNMVIDAYNKQKTRGAEGFGYVAVRDGIAHVVRSEKEEDILKSLRRERANEILFHHRRPTSTDNFELATHPIVVSNKLLKYDYLVVHNGVINNDDWLKGEHEKLGFQYTTEHKLVKSLSWNNGSKVVTEESKFNDSESLAIEAALYVENQQTEMRFSGTAAFIMYQIEKNTGRVISLIWARNTGNPLFEDEIRAKKLHVVLLRSFTSGKSVEPGKLFAKSYVTGQVIDETVAIGRTWGNTSYSNRKDYMGYRYEQEEDTRRYLPPPETRKTDKEYLDEIFPEGGGVNVHIPRLPVPGDFSDNSMALAEVRKAQEDLDDEIAVLEAEMDFWRIEMKTAAGADLVAMREELKNAEVKYNDKLERLDLLNDVYGVESPYQELLKSQD